MKKQIIILSVFAALLFTSGCSPRILVREVVRDSLIVRTTLDSVYLYEKDSIFIKQKGDTVFFERWSIFKQYNINLNTGQYFFIML